MSFVLAINIALMGIVLVGIVAVHHWAIRTQHHDWPEQDAVERRQGLERRARAHANATAERRRGDRRLSQPATAR